jgi:hypothetical protein
MRTHNLFKKEIEEKIRKKTSELLKEKRGGWDLKHTLVSVKWMKKLIEEYGGNKKILTTTMYFHDTGYEDLKDNYTHKDVIKAKKYHTETGAENARRFLAKISDFSQEEINRISYLILKHDDFEFTKEKDRQLVFDADSLAQIDWENCPPNYNKNNCEEFLNTDFKKRVKCLNTERAKKTIKHLLISAKKYLEKK